MPTTARYRALQWFFDHETCGPNEVFTRREPTTRMHRLMAKDGQVAMLPVGQFGFSKWILTPLGRQALEKKPTRKRKPRVE